MGAATFAKPGAEKDNGQEEAWAKIKSMAGMWKGIDGTKDPVKNIEREFEMIVQGNFMVVRTKSVSTKEVHEDWAIFSYDKDRQKVIMRQFASEGFVNRFTLDEISDDGKTLTFLTEHCENAAGFKVRMVYTLESEDSFKQRMDLAPPGAKFFTCVGGHLKRQE